MRRKILLIVGLVILFVIAFIGAIFWMFPTDSIRHLAEETIEKQLKQKQSVEIEDLVVSPLLNMTMRGFRMTPRASDESSPVFATEGGTFGGYYCAPYVPEQSFVVDEVFVSPEILSLFSKNYAADFALKMQEGVIDGKVKTVEKKVQITAAGEGISLNEFALLSNLTRTQLYGAMSFDLRAVMDANKLAELFVKMKSDNTVMCPKRFNLNVPSLPYIEFPFTIFGNISADIEVANDKIVINQLTSDGPDIVMKVTGDIVLKSSKNPDARLNIVADIKPSQAWVEDNDMKVIYQMCEKLDDGGIRLVLRGTTKRLKHDCGTPIPEPIPEAAPAAPDQDTADDAKEKELEKETEAETEKVGKTKSKKRDRAAAKAAEERKKAQGKRAMPRSNLGQKKK